jgi:hypothetical protein
MTCRVKRIVVIPAHAGLGRGAIRSGRGRCAEKAETDGEWHPSAILPMAATPAMSPIAAGARAWLARMAGAAGSRLQAGVTAMVDALAGRVRLRLNLLNIPIEGAEADSGQRRRRGGPGERCRNESDGRNRSGESTDETFQRHGALLSTTAAAQLIVYGVERQGTLGDDITFATLSPATRRPSLF